MKLHKTFLTYFFLTFAGSSLIIFVPSVNAEDEAKPESTEEVKESSSDEKGKMGGKGKKKEYESIDEFLEDGEYKSIDGFMNLLHETEKDKYFLVLEESELDKEFIYFAYILNGPQDVGASGGSMGEGSILEFRKFKDDIGSVSYTHLRAHET